MDEFDQIIDRIVEEDSQYKKGAYTFVREALEYTVKNLKPEELTTHQHIAGERLLEGIRDYALLQYGPMTMTLMNEWNVKNCEDFGHIVFKLVENKVLGKTDEDSMEDFKGGYDFKDAFEKPFMPENWPDAS